MAPFFQPPQGYSLKGPKFSALLHICTWFIVGLLMGNWIVQMLLSVRKLRDELEPHFTLSYKGCTGTMSWDLLLRMEVEWPTQLLKWKQYAIHKTSAYMGR